MLKELLDDHQTGMSEFQDDYLVTTRAGGTLYGQYKQSLRELYKRFRGLREQSCDLEKLLIEIEQQEHIIRTSNDQFEVKFAEVEFKRKTMVIEEAERVIKDNKREFTRFYQQAAYFKSLLGDITDEKRKILDREMWEFKVKEMMYIDIKSTGRLKNSTLEFINSFPKDKKIELLSYTYSQESVGKLLEWYEEKDEIHIPDDLPLLESPDIKQLESL